MHMLFSDERGGNEVVIKMWWEHQGLTSRHATMFCEHQGLTSRKANEQSRYQPGQNEWSTADEWGSDESAGADEQGCKKSGWQAKTTNRSTSAQKLVGLTFTCASLWVRRGRVRRQRENRGWRASQPTVQDIYAPAACTSMTSIYISVYVFETEISTCMYSIV